MNDETRTDDADSCGHGHLDEMDFAILQASAVPVDQRLRIVKHLSECEDCSQRMAAIRVLDSGDPNSLATFASVPELPDRIRASLLDAFRSSFAATTGPSWRKQAKLALRTPAAWLQEPDEPASAKLAWAADAHPSGSPEELPVLATEDGRIRVRFRRPGDGSQIRAYLLAPADWAGSGVSLLVPSRQLSFRIGFDGTADLPGIDAADLSAGALELMLEPEPGGDEPAI